MVLLLHEHICRSRSLRARAPATNAHIHAGARWNATGSRQYALAAARVQTGSPATWIWHTTFSFSAGFYLFGDPCVQSPSTCLAAFGEQPNKKDKKKQKNTPRQIISTVRHQH